jgi:hypothetical protein
MTNNITVGGVLSRALDIYSKRFGQLIGIAAVIFIPVGILEGLARDAGAFGSLIAWIASVVGTALFTGAVVRVVEAAESGAGNKSIGEVFSSLGDRIWPLIWVGVIVGIAQVIGFILFIVPGIILVVIWAVWQPVVVVENKNFDALSRSRELVKGNGWNVFGLMIVVLFLAFLVFGLGAGLGAIIGGVVGAVVVTIVFAVLLSPIGGVIYAELYFQLAGATAGDASAAPVPVGDTPPPPPSPEV